MSSAAAFRGYLERAHDALGGGEFQEGERLAKAVSALVRAERDVAALLLETVSKNDDEDAVRAELQRRLGLFAKARRAGSSLEELARIAATGVDT